MCAGLPKGCSQAIYDAALAGVFKRHDREEYRKNAELLLISSPRTLEEFYAQRLRFLCERQAAERAELQAQVGHL
jgi:hypothetical protein